MIIEFRGRPSFNSMSRSFLNNLLTPAVETYTFLKYARRLIAFLRASMPFFAPPAYTYPEKENSTMRSDKMKKGIEKAPHRSLFKAAGLSDDELSRPIIGLSLIHISEPTRPY